MNLGPHPRERRLLAWLDGAEDDGVESHIDGCARCAALVERLSGDDIDTPPDDDTGDELELALRALTEPPDDLDERIRAHLATRRRQQHEVELLGGLLGLAGDTLRAIQEPEEDDS